MDLITYTFGKLSASLVEKLFRRRGQWNPLELNRIYYNELNSKVFSKLQPLMVRKLLLLKLSRIQKMKYMIIFAIGILTLAGCTQSQTTMPSSSTASSSKTNDDVQTLTLQYRIWMDAVAPSKFVAIYPNGMSMGLKVHWKIEEEKRKELDDLLAQLEKEGVNGREFTVKAKWIHKGFELEVYEIEKEF